ncbi:hypothetical protein HOK68_04055, partial [Candidatus Woesearchaeota archaeon]|nr:hypothetical protein [Candidatus Woesearchaeota archaeon]
TEIDLEIFNDKEHLEFKKLKEELDNNKFYFESKRYQLGFHYFYVLEDSTFQPYFSSKPVFMDTMFEHLGSDNRHKSKDQLVTNYTTDKNLTKILLREHGIPVARDRIITRKNISKLEKIIKDFTFKTQSKSLVFKANNGSCGDEVIITHPNETKKIKQFVNKHLEYGIVLLEERLIPRKFKVNRQKLDANMRILAILTDHCEYVGGVVRMQSWGNKPVNLSGAANRYNLEDYAKEVNFTINELAEFTRKAGQPLADIRQEHHPIMLGLDITLTDNEFHVIEINSSGSAGYHSLGLTTNHNQPRVKYMVSKLCEVGYQNFTKRKKEKIHFTKRKESYDIRFLRAINCFKNEDYELAEKFLKSLANLIPEEDEYKNLTSEEIKCWIGVGFCKQGIKNEAREYLKDALQYNEMDFIGAFIDSAKDIYEINKGFELLLPKAEKGTRLYKVVQENYLETLFRLNEREKAISLIEKLKPEKEFRTTIFNKLIKNLELDYAKTLLEDLPDTRKGEINKLFYYLETNQYKKSIDLLENNKHIEYGKEGFLFSAKLKEDFKIEKVLNRDYQNQGNNEYSIFLLGMARYLSGQKVQSLILFRNLTKNLSYQPFIFKNIIEFYKSQNDQKFKDLYLNYCSKNELPRTQRLIKEAKQSKNNNL